MSGVLFGLYFLALYVVFLVLDSLQFIKNRPEPIRTAGYNYAGFAAHKSPASSEGHHVFLHIAPRPIGKSFWHMPCADEFMSNIECVTAPFRFERATVGIGLDELGVERFLDDGDSNLVRIHERSPRG